MSMRRTVIGGACVRVLLCAGALALGGCEQPSEQTADLKPPPGFSPPPVQTPQKVPLRADRVDFGTGFSSVEHDRGNTWRWMGARGEVHLGYRMVVAEGSTGRPYRLRVVGWFARDEMKRAPTIRITLGGQLVGSFSPEGDNFDQAWTVPVDLARTAANAPLVIETDTVVHAPGDSRDLGLAISAIDWRPLPP